MTALGLAIQRAQARLLERLQELEEAIVSGRVEAWPEYRDTAVALSKLAATAERRADFLTTAELAARLNVSTRTVRRRKKDGTLSPALQLGERVQRWRA